MEKTDQTLLIKLRNQHNEEAWSTFFKRYSVAMFCYARKLGLTPTEADEAVQESMITLMRALPKFNYNPERGLFRNYVFTIIHRRSAQIAKKRKQDHVPLGEWIPDNSESAETATEPDEEGWQAALLMSAWESLRRTGIFSDRTISVFEALCFSGQNVEAVAKAHGLAPNAVYQIKHRITKRLSVEVSKLSEGIE